MTKNIRSKSITGLDYKRRKTCAIKCAKYLPTRTQSSWDGQYQPLSYSIEIIRNQLGSLLATLQISTTLPNIGTRTSACANCTYTLYLPCTLCIPQQFNKSKMVEYCMQEKNNREKTLLGGLQKIGNRKRTNWPRFGEGSEGGPSPFPSPCLVKPAIWRCQFTHRLTTPKLSIFIETDIFLTQPSLSFISRDNKNCLYIFRCKLCQISSFQMSPNGNGHLQVRMAPTHIGILVTESSRTYYLRLKSG